MTISTFSYKSKSQRRNRFPRSMEEDYQKLVGETWNPLVVTPNVTFMKQLSKNLQKIKKVTKPWARDYSTNQQKQLKEVEISLKENYRKNKFGIFTEEELKEVREKELKREELLAREKELLRLQSRAIWIKEGDNNTIFFHHFSNHRRNLNTISTIKDMNGVMVSSFKEKTEVRERF